MGTWEKEAEQKYNIEGLAILRTYDVYNMLVSALEGGSNYWYLIGEVSEEEVRNVTVSMKGQPFVDRLLTAIQKHNVKVEIYDFEEKEFLGTIDKNSWAKAEKLMIEKERSHLGDVLKEQDDATTGDVFFQLAVMGELVYG